ncbi:group II intron reverse transcriptase/maturase [Pedobacter sp. SL55]|uniref:group II intron reverse transcriptase/maturase n=1 Tax=Pedobacter sp. SL55 TaxID=2995161 RepID=UPI0022714023|nr:group II intron reverse transcriptase/maturase [Pedobacter sp. SL55]WAC41057.1 group II intron reverse transcriptase/maturase [Pedobacter sp. SL55]WAC41434.1 group II intron reverse transcriptase/maturase [Pedobacter sp. SL55]
MEMVREAYRKVKSNRGSAGVDKESLEEFETDLSNNLYVIWNRLSSGSYFPKPVRSVAIPKANGKKRFLGIPTVSDRIAQQVLKTYLEPRLEAVFAKESYGYRPLRGAHQAVSAVQKNVRQYPWAIDMDISNFFDEVDHSLLMKSIDVHVEERWAKMYIKRWLESPVQQADGSLSPKAGKGTPQGGVISPLLANLFLHYVLDKWLGKYYPQVAFVRYADDIIIHCSSETEGKQVLDGVRSRLRECKLGLNEEKTKMVYCQDYRRKRRKDYAKKFDFLGFTFKPRTVVSKREGLFLGYGCAISQTSQTRIVEGWRRLKWHNRSDLDIQDIAGHLNVQMAGIIRYYGKFNLMALRKLMWHFEFRLAKWVLNKYKSFRNSYTRAYRWIKELKRSYPAMFYYWTVFKHV